VADAADSSARCERDYRNFQKDIEAFITDRYLPFDFRTADCRIVYQWGTDNFYASISSPKTAMIMTSVGKRDIEEGEHREKRYQNLAFDRTHDLRTDYAAVLH
jgi:hypothetical protein